MPEQVVEQFAPLKKEPAPAALTEKPSEQLMQSKKELAPSQNAGKMRAARALVQEQEAAPAAGAPAQPEAKRKAPAFGGGPEPVHDQIPQRIIIEREVLQKVMTHFMNNDLPDQMKTKDVKIAPQRIRPETQDISWMDAATIDALATCKNAYLINAERVETKLRFLYCADNDAVKLIAKFELQNGIWKKVK